MAAGVRTPDALGLGCRFVGHHSIGGLAPPADVSNVVLRLLRYESHAVFGSGISHSFGVLAMRSSRIHSGSRVFLRFRSPANARISGSRIPLVRDDLENGSDYYWVRVRPGSAGRTQDFARPNPNSAGQPAVCTIAVGANSNYEA
jgi:hypothetical protein